MRREKLSADTEDADVFRTDIHCLIKRENLTDDQIYNCDETGLNFKILPTRTWASRREKAKQRITVLVCCNVYGRQKLRFMVIGQSKKPGAFYHVSLQPLLLSHENQRNAWLNRNGFLANVFLKLKIF